MSEIKGAPCMHPVRTFQRLCAQFPRVLIQSVHIFSFSYLSLLHIRRVHVEIPGHTVFGEVHACGYTKYKYDCNNIIYKYPTMDILCIGVPGVYKILLFLHNLKHRLNLGFLVLYYSLCVKRTSVFSGQNSWSRQCPLYS